MDIRKYNRKPDQVDAVQFTGGLPNAPETVNWVLNNGGTAVWLDKQDPTVTEDGTVIPGRDEILRVLSPSETYVAKKGDYVVNLGDKFVVMSPDEFEKRYEPVL